MTIDAEAPETLRAHGLTLPRIRLSASGNDVLRARYLGSAASGVYLVRPDQYVAARWERFDEDAVVGALAQALALETPPCS